MNVQILVLLENSADDVQHFRRTHTHTHTHSSPNTHSSIHSVIHLNSKWWKWC